MPLPTAKTEKEANYLKKKYLIYGTPKIGKSTVVANIGNDDNKVLFFATEQGHTELEIYKWTKENGQDPLTWDDFRQCVMEVTKDDAGFSCLAVDTIDNLYMWCATYICKKHKVEHESDLAFGKGYNLIKEEMMKVINYLTQKGIGVIFISHKSDSEKTKDGRKMSCIEPSLANTGKKVITGLCDYILYFYADSEGHRLIRTKGTESIEAGDRSGKLPAVLEMNSDKLKTLLKGE